MISLREFETELRLLLIGRTPQRGAVSSTPLNRHDRAHFKDYFMSLLSSTFSIFLFLFNYKVTKLDSFPLIRWSLLMGGLSYK